MESYWVMAATLVNLTSFLMTSFLDPETGPEKRYNYSHKKGLAVLSGCLGCGKDVFHVCQDA